MANAFRRGSLARLIFGAPAALAAPVAKAEKPASVAGHSPGPGQRQSLSAGVAAMMALVALLTLGLYAPADFLQHFTVFVLACFVGWQVVWNVTPALHTPLMSVTNAISGIIIVGGMLQLSSDWKGAAAILGAGAVLLASVNVVGGFQVTARMLRMFHRGEGRNA